MVTQWFGWTRGLVLAVGVLLLLLAALGTTAARADVILDDPFDGNSLDPNLWRWVSTNPQWQPVVSGGRLTLSAQGEDWILLGSRADAGNYTSPTFYDVRVESAGDDFSFDFGYGVELLGGWAYLEAHASALRVSYTNHTAYGAQLGPWMDGADYALDWTPSFFRAYRDGALLYSEDDPDRVPYYELLGLSIWVQDGTVSIDRVVVLTPEPGTLTLLTAGAVLCLRRRGKR